MGKLNLKAFKNFQIGNIWGGAPGIIWTKVYCCTGTPGGTDDVCFVCDANCGLGS